MSGMLSVMKATETTCRSGVYSIRCVETGRVYVGSSHFIKRRLNGHRQHLRKGQHHSSPLQNAWDKYGEAAFAFEILEEVSDLEHLFAREQFWIEHLGAYVRRGGFNIYPAAGSPLGFKQTPETRARMSAAKKGDWKMAESHKRAVSLAAKVTNSRRKGQPHGPMTEEHKQAISAGLQGKMAGARPWRRGVKKKMSEEGLAAIAEANARRRGRMPEKQRAAIIAANRRRKGEKRPRASI